MKVLLINSLFGKKVSGSGQHIYNLWKYLKDKVDFVIWDMENVGYINIPKLKSISFYIKAKWKKIPKDIDIMHIHNPKFAGLFEKEKGNILTIHGDYKRELEIRYGFLAKPVIKYIDSNISKADVITTVSPLWARLNGWKWIPNMVEISEIWKIEPIHKGNIFKGIKPGKYILFVGRDEPVKDYPLFRKIAEEVWRQLEVKSIALGVIRENTDYLIHAKVAWKVVISLMKSALALVITSRHEGFPTVLLEAWASGCPVVARRIPPLAELGRLFDNSMLTFGAEGGGLVESAVLKLTLLYHNEAFRKYFIARGYEAVKNFDAPVVADQYYKLYKEVLR
ncbi:MAG TPA: glycosyltransferase [Candidatus Bathyarchaeota archaeon]|nr:glycosyltransferase [Candidatus Bathyarchaeota archaeon]